MTLADSDHYAESFADVSDWLEYSCEIAATLSSDGDVFSWEDSSATDNNPNGYYADIPTLDLSAGVVEFTAKVNSTANYDYSQLRLLITDDGTGGDYYHKVFTLTTSWQTFNFGVNDLVKAGNGDLTAIESIMFLHWIDSAAGTKVQQDYLRGARTDEMGWQHDFSTTSGISSADGGTIASDDDAITLTADGDGSTFLIVADTTATAAAISCTYYPFFGIDIDSGSGSWTLDQYDGSAYATLQTSTAISAGIKHFNMRALDTYVSWWRITLTASGVFVSDWAKAYSIANFTVTQSGAGTDDYLYVDSGVLYSNIDDGYIEMNHDPALSVPDTYSYYNLTTSGTAPEFSQYVSDWSTYSDDTRGATTSGTVIDIKLKFDSTEIISAVKFIEDGIAPAVVRSSSTPNDPEDDEAVILSAVITDAVGVWSVVFDAIVCPTGFSDVDYDASEQADNLWTYEFSSLDAGYYCFKIIATDGANNNSLTEYAYIELTVREAAIRVEEITLIGAGSDFEMMTFSARINRDCSFTIYEESASSPESDTHTGSVTAPSFNLAWTKLDVEDSNVNFTIKFVSGSLTYNYTSQYQVAQTTFYVSTVTQMVSLDTVTVTGRITKLGAYQVYDDLNVLKDYGTLADLDFKVQFTRWGGYDEQNHDFAIKFTNGTQTCWYNSSFYAFKKPVVAPFPIEDKNALYAFQASFWTAVMIFFVMLMIGIDFYRRNK